jgi:hypothetical protein
MNLRTLRLMAFLAFAVFTASCDKENDVDPNEEELITTLKVSLIEAGTTTPQVFVFKDIDGPGGQAPSQFDSIIINANKSYTASVQFLNESVSPADDITLEVSAEAADHQVYYQATTVVLPATNLNIDGLGLPLGITSTWTAGAAGKGAMKITLKHKPGTKAANDPVTKGETDIEVEFGVRLK